MNERRVLVASLLAFGLASCGSNGSLPPASQAAAPAADAGAAVRGASLELTIKIPPAPRKAQYVSPSTKSLSIYEGETHLRTLNTTASTKNCRVSQGATLCTYNFGAIPGKHELFTVDTFDEKNGAGKLLASGAVTKNVGVGRNTIPITLRGTVAKLSVALIEPNPPAGLPATSRVVVTAEDPDGNVIVAPGNYSEKISLTNSDTTGTTKLSSSEIAGPNDDVKLEYDGNSIESATIGAGASGVSPSDVTAATFAPSPRVVGSYELPLGTRGTALEPTAIAKGPGGEIWFGVCCKELGIVKMTPAGEMTFYRAGVPPSGKLPKIAITGIAPGSDGNVWYAAGPNVGKITPNGEVKNYRFAGGGLCLAAVALRIVPAADGGIWVSTGCPKKPFLRVAHVTTRGTIVASSLDPSMLTIFGGLALGKDGNLYFAATDVSRRSGAIERAVVAGDRVVATSIVPVPGTVTLVGVAQTPDGDVWATNGDCRPSLIVRVHPETPFASSAVSKFKTLAGCSSPAYLAAVAGGSLWVAEHGYALVTRVTPAAYPAPPQLTDFPVPTPHSVAGRVWDVTAGALGDLYFANAAVGTTGHSSNVIRIAY